MAFSSHFTAFNEFLAIHLIWATVRPQSDQDLTRTLSLLTCKDFTGLSFTLLSPPVSSLFVRLAHINSYSVLFLWQSSVSWFWLFWVLEADWRWWWWSRCLLWSWHCMISWDADRRSNISCLSHLPGAAGGLPPSIESEHNTAGLDWTGLCYRGTTRPDFVSPPQLSPTIPISPTMSIF